MKLTLKLKFEIFKEINLRGYFEALKLILKVLKFNYIKYEKKKKAAPTNGWGEERNGEEECVCSESGSSTQRELSRILFINLINWERVWILFSGTLFWFLVPLP